MSELIDTIKTAETWPYIPKGVSNAITTNDRGDADPQPELGHFTD
jgi:hypothetical protein